MVDSDITDTDDNVEVLEYKLEEVQGFHDSDFGELILSKEIKDEFNANITNPDLDKAILYKELIRRLYTTLINKNLDTLDDRLKSRIIKKLVDFSEIIHIIQETRQKMTKNHSINDLKKIYMDNIKFLQNAYTSKRNVLISSVSIQSLIAIIVFFIGMSIQKLFNII